MFLRLLVESLRQARRRKLVAVAAIGLGTFAATAVATLLLASGDRLAAELASYGANLELTPTTGETLAVAGLAKARTIFWRHNLVGIAPLRTQRVGWTRVRAKSTSDGGAHSPRELVEPLVGTWFDAVLDGGWRTGLPHTRPTLVPAGRWPRESAAEVVLGRRLAARLATATGDRVTVRLGERTLDLTVVGILAGGGEEEDQGFAPLAAVEGLAGGAGAVQRAEVLAVTVPERDVSAKDPASMSAADYDAWYCTAYASSIARQLEEAVPGVRAAVVRSVAGAGGDVLLRLRGVLLVFAVLLLAAAVLGTTAAMTATTLERRLEVGLFAALGAEPLQVAAFFLVEAAMLGLTGGLVGGLFGLAGGRLLGAAVFGVRVPWAPILLPFAVAAGVAVALFGSAPPVLRSVRSDAARTLRRATA